MKLLFKYKAIKFGANYQEVSESYTSQTCHVCGDRNGPRGTAGLSIRSWTCSACQAIHDRDINAAKNIEKRFDKGKSLFPQYH